MKDEARHIQHLQKKVIRSTRRRVVKKREQEEREAEGDSAIKNEGAYHENVPADQQVPRAPTRQNYH